MFCGVERRDGVCGGELKSVMVWLQVNDSVRKRERERERERREEVVGTKGKGGGEWSEF